MSVNKIICENHSKHVYWPFTKQQSINSIIIHSFYYALCSFIHSILLWLTTIYRLVIKKGTHWRIVYHTQNHVNVNKYGKTYEIAVFLLFIKHMSGPCLSIFACVFMFLLSIAPCLCRNSKKPALCVRLLWLGLFVYLLWFNPWNLFDAGRRIVDGDLHLNCGKKRYIWGPFSVWENTVPA